MIKNNATQNGFIIFTLDMNVFIRIQTSSAKRCNSMRSCPRCSWMSCRSL